MESAIPERLAKLLELSRRGVGGEAVNATRILNELLAKLGMTIDDLEVDQEKYREVPVHKHDPEKGSILMQTVFKVTDRHSIFADRLPGRKPMIAFKLTDRQFAEVMLLYPAYMDEYEQDLHALFIAFCAKNRILPASPSPKQLADPASEKKEAKKVKVDHERIDKFMPAAASVRPPFNRLRSEW